jgi:2-methylcitrate dehydratase PrpD
MANSISRQFGRWAAGLTYDDLPPAVVDKVKALILVHLVSGVFGGASKRGREAVDLILAEEGKPDGATVLGHGGRATRIGATYANAEMMKAEEHLEDSFRMITHPGGSLIPAALVNAELEGRTLRR